MKRTALVTGANRGIGLAIATQLAETDHAVLLGSRDIDLGEQAAAPLIARGLDVTPLQVDVGTVEGVDFALWALTNAAQEVDILVNNAGVLHQGSRLLELTDEEVEESLAVHVTGPLRLIRALSPGMIDRGYGRIVNLSSGWGSFGEGLDGPEAYGMTKAALNAMTVRLAKDLPPTVKINTMCPGWVRTRMGGAGATRSPEKGADTAVWLATIADDGPTGGFFRDRKPIKW